MSVCVLLLLSLLCVQSQEGNAVSSEYKIVFPKDLTGNKNASPPQQAQQERPQIKKPEKPVEKQDNQDKSKQEAVKKDADKSSQQNKQQEAKKVNKTTESADFQAIDNRFKIRTPDDPRFKRADGVNPYTQNKFKGDFPIIGNDKFLNMTLESETGVNLNRVPVPQGVSARNPGSQEFFGNGRLDQFQQNLLVSFDFFKGDASFKPVDWRMKVTGVFNYNVLRARELGVVNADVRKGRIRKKNFAAVQEVFFEKRLGDTTKIFPFLRGDGSQGGRSAEFDTTSARLGIQEFNSDFRGFLFNDTNLGGRVFGNFKSNRWQYNLLGFEMLEKDTNSLLNNTNFTEFKLRNQHVYIANFIRQDTFVEGYTAQFSVHYNDDKASRFLDDNGFTVRPALIGSDRPHRIRSGYFGFNGDGHFGRINITHSFYQAIGRDEFNPISGKATRINAQMAAAELSIDKDYIRYRVSGFYASGDKDPLDGTANGFDAIQDNPNFAGGQFSFWTSQGIAATSTNVLLKSPNSLIPSLRASKFQGQQNFINPGIGLLNAGIDIDVTPKLRTFVNYNYLRFNEPQVLEQVAFFQNKIRHEIGHDLGVGFIYRPLLSENIVLTMGTAGLKAGRGFTDIYTSNCGGTPAGCGAGRPTLWNAFLKLKFQY